MPSTAAGLVPQTERSEWEIKLTSSFVAVAFGTTLQPGCTGVVPPFDVHVGRFAVVRYP